MIGNALLGSTYPSIRERLLPKAVPAALLTAVATLLLGCGAHGDMQVDEGELVGETQDEIRSGIVVSKRGVVEFNGCTGVMIGPRHMLTSAGCVVGDIEGHEGFVQGTVRYFDPNDSALEAGESRKVSDTDEWFHVFAKSTFRWYGDTESDIAVVERDADWKNTDNTDYQRLSLGSCGMMDKSTLYGQGNSGFKGEGEGTLRKSAIDLNSCNEHSFTHLEGSDATCNGDEGGPHIMKVQIDDDLYDVVTGLLSNFDRPAQGTRRCTAGGGKQRAVRINADKMQFIESIVGQCEVFSADDSHTYKRCWRT